MNHWPLITKFAKCGHPRTPKNISKYPGEAEKCLRCKRERALEYYYARKERELAREYPA